MKNFLFSALAILAALGCASIFPSCASNSGGAGDGTYQSSPSLSPVDATDQMRSEYREWIR